MFCCSAVKLSRLSACAALFVWAWMPLLAQEPTGKYVLRGEVRGPGEYAIASALVTVIGTSSTMTADDGTFALTGLDRGTRILEVRSLGYKPLWRIVFISDTTPNIVVSLDRLVVTLDAVKVVARTEMQFQRRADRISSEELSAPEVLGGTAFEAVALLRPQILVPRAPMTFMQEQVETTPRDLLHEMNTGTRAINDAKGSVLVSVNEGPVKEIDTLQHLSVRIIREIRYLRAIEASAQFGAASKMLPVLVVYTR